MNSQLALFAPEPAAPVRAYGGPKSVQRLMELAFTEPVKLELLAVAAAHPGEWLKWRDFKAPMEKHDIGFCMGHVLCALVRDGRLLEKTVYLGKGLEADRPGSPDYQGYTHHWMAPAARTPTPQN